MESVSEIGGIINDEKVSLDDVKGECREWMEAFKKGVHSLDKDYTGKSKFHNKVPKHAQAPLARYQNAVMGKFAAKLGLQGPPVINENPVPDLNQPVEHISSQNDHELRHLIHEYDNPAMNDIPQPAPPPPPPPVEIPPPPDVPPPEVPPPVVSPPLSPSHSGEIELASSSEEEQFTPDMEKYIEYINDDFKRIVFKSKLSKSSLRALTGRYALSQWDPEQRAVFDAEIAKWTGLVRRGRGKDVISFDDWQKTIALITEVPEDDESDPDLPAEPALVEDIPEFLRAPTPPSPVNEVELNRMIDDDLHRSASDVEEPPAVPEPELIRVINDFDEDGLPVVREVEHNEPVEGFDEDGLPVVHEPENLPEWADPRINPSPYERLREGLFKMSTDEEIALFHKTKDELIQHIARNGFNREDMKQFKTFLTDLSKEVSRHYDKDDATTMLKLVNSLDADLMQIYESPQAPQESQIVHQEEMEQQPVPEEQVATPADEAEMQQPQYQLPANTQPPNQPVKLAELPGRGWGLVATNRIPKGTLITYYGGRMLDNKDEARRMRDTQSDTHILTFEQGQYVDGRIQPEHGLTPEYYVENGLLAQFANEEEKSNTKFVRVQASKNSNGAHFSFPNNSGQRTYGAGRAIKALRDIEPGEEVTVYYGKDYRRNWPAGQYIPKSFNPRKRRDDDYRP